MNTSELLHCIAKDRVAGMRNIDSYQLKPIVVAIVKPKQAIDLKNDIWILNTRYLPDFMKEITLVSSDNVFATSKEEYEFMDEFRYQTFTDYLDIKVETEVFKPFRLEFVKIIPHRN